MLKLIRNIGICAHIDAGKTTLTERIIYYSGQKHKIGEVHDGEATMDWMDQEQERGITINSASTTFFWNVNNFGNFKINLIDTPGHVDFTAEVERSMRVLDGVCLVLCSVGRVQPQTETVWKQIRRYNVPCVIFVNKLDRIGANFNKTCLDIKKKLGIPYIKLQKPIIKNSEFIGIYDILEEKKVFYKGENGQKIVFKKLNKKQKKEIIKKKNNIIEKLIEKNDYLIEKYLSGDLSNNDIYNLIREKTISGNLVPVLCGSAFKNKGVQNLLDCVVKFLPSPKEKKNVFYSLDSKSKGYINVKKKTFCSLVFKIINDQYCGKIFFSRIYSGEVRPGDYVYNVNNKTRERIGRILEYKASKKEDKKTACSGDIIAFTGFKKTNTGDTICSEDDKILLEKIKFPDPVISFSIFPKESSKFDRLLSAVKKNSVEDPTILLSTDRENGNLIISGMGELHIDVFLERIRREYDIELYKKNPKVSYRETISKACKSSEGKYIRQSGGRGQYGHVLLRVFPRKTGKGVKFVNSIRSGSIPKEYIKPIKKSIFSCCEKGVLTNSKIVDIKIELFFGSYHEVDSSENAFKIAASIAFKKAILEASPIILEPIMKTSIFVPEEYLGSVISDLSSRRGLIILTEKRDIFYFIKANVPMSNMFDYATRLRSLTKGRGNYTMSFGFYKKLNKELQEKIVSENVKH